MSSAGEAAPSKNRGEKTIWKVSATIANKRAMRRRGPGEIVMVSGFIPPAPLSKLSRMPNHRACPSGLEHPTRSVGKNARQTSKNVLTGVPAYGRHRSFRMGDKPEITQQKGFWRGPILHYFRIATIRELGRLRAASELTCREFRSYHQSAIRTHEVAT
jgi:hypothetical protein